MSRTLLFSLLLTVLLLAACTSLYSANAASKWPQLGQDYLRSLRWRDYSATAAFFVEEERATFLARSDELNALQMVDGRLESHSLADDRRHAETVIVLEYYRLPSAKVRQVTLRQQWEYRQEGNVAPGAWFVVTPLAAFP